MCVTIFCILLFLVNAISWKSLQSSIGNYSSFMSTFHCIPRPELIQPVSSLSSHSLLMDIWAVSCPLLLETALLWGLVCTAPSHFTSLSLGEISRSGIAGSEGKCIDKFARCQILLYSIIPLTSQAFTSTSSRLLNQSLCLTYLQCPIESENRNKPFSLTVCLLSLRKLQFGHFWSPNLWAFSSHRAVLQHQLGCPPV